MSFRVRTSFLPARNGASPRILVRAERETVAVVRSSRCPDVSEHERAVWSAFPLSGHDVAPDGSHSRGFWFRVT